jgi:hypothetical protein
MTVACQHRFVLNLKASSVEKPKNYRDDCLCGAVGIQVTSERPPNRRLLDNAGVVHFAKMITWNPETRLRNVFAKALHKGHVRNAELSPQAPEQIASLLSLGEKCVVVRDKKRRLLWVTDRRLLREDGPAVSELFAFSAVERVHWMSRENRFQLSKSDNFDRLEIDLTPGETREVTLDGLDQAVFPLLNFLQWFARKRITDE